MWARTAEVTLSCFLAVSSFFFPFERNLLPFDMIVAFFIGTFSLLSFYHPLRKIHLVNLFFTFVLIGYAFLEPGNPPPPPFQNYMVLGIIFFMLNIIPSQASKPPLPWSKFYEE